MNFRHLLLIAGMFLFASCSNDNGSADVGPSTAGTGGSLARFTIAGDHLYAVDQSNLFTFSIEAPTEPKKVDKFELDWGVETIFTLDETIFIGTETGMHMLDITNPSRPAYLSGYDHVQACDPVVAQDTLAFVTLRSGTNCRNDINQLEVINIKDKMNPKILEVYQMENPHGLAVKGNHLFVTEGQFGLKVFEIQEKGKLELLKFYNGMRGNDIILQNDVMIVVADDGLFQYDYSDVMNITQLSEMRIEF